MIAVGMGRFGAKPMPFRRKKHNKNVKGNTLIAIDEGMITRQPKGIRGGKRRHIGFTVMPTICADAPRPI